MLSGWYQQAKQFAREQTDENYRDERRCHL